MSLSKSIASKFGVTAEYWKVARREFDDINNKAEITLYGYSSKAAQQAGAEKMEHRKLDLPYADVRGLNARQTAEYIISNIPEFQSGVPE